MCQSSFLLIFWFFDPKNDNWSLIKFLHLVGFSQMLAKSINSTVLSPVVMLVHSS